MIQRNIRVIVDQIIIWFLHMVPKYRKTAKFSFCAIQHPILVLKFYNTIVVRIDLYKKSSLGNVKVRIDCIYFELKVEVLGLIRGQTRDTPSSFVPVHPVRELPVCVVVSRKGDVNSKILTIIILKNLISIQAILKSLIPPKCQIIWFNDFIRGCLI